MIRSRPASGPSVSIQPATIAATPPPATSARRHAGRAAAMPEANITANHTPVVGCMNAAAIVHAAAQDARARAAAAAAATPQTNAIMRGCM